jgi:hypothetical protein
MTSSLSGTRSNQLSYEPVASRSDTGPSFAGRNTPPCRRGSRRAIPNTLTRRPSGGLTPPSGGEQCSLPDLARLSSKRQWEKSAGGAIRVSSPGH